MRFTAEIVDVGDEPEQERHGLLDPSKLGTKVVIRNWRAGDRFWPANTSKEKKVKELLSDRHATGREKKLWPVAEWQDELVWLRGFAAPEAWQASSGKGDLDSGDQDPLTTGYTEEHRGRLSYAGWLRRALNSSRTCCSVDSREPELSITKWAALIFSSSGICAAMRRSDLGAGGVFGDALASGKALDALLGLAGNDDQMIESVGGVGFEDKSRFHDGDGIRIALADFFHPLVFIADDGRMNDGIEFVNARQERMSPVLRRRLRQVWSD